MLDIKLLRQNFQAVKEKLSARGEDLSDLEQFEAVDEKRRELIAKTEELKAKRNQVSKEIATLKREKQDADAVIKEIDRKSTRLNSSHVAISYAVFCLKKK